MPLTTSAIVRFLKQPAVAIVLGGAILAFFEAMGWGILKPTDKVGAVAAQTTALSATVQAQGTRLDNLEGKVDLILKGQCVEIMPADAVKIGLPCRALIPDWPDILRKP